MDLIQAVELLIDDGFIPEIVPDDDGKYSFEIDSLSLIQLSQKGSAVIVSCGLSSLNKIEPNLALVLDRWLGLSLASMMSSDSVLSFYEESKIFFLHRILDLKKDKEVGLLAAIEALIIDAEEYRETLK